MKSPAGSMSSGHTIIARKKITVTAMMVGLRTRATSSISAALSTDEASSAPAFFTCVQWDHIQDGARVSHLMLTIAAFPPCCESEASKLPIFIFQALNICLACQDSNCTC